MVNGALGCAMAGGIRFITPPTSSSPAWPWPVAFHARLFNIGGEGQAMLGGLGVALACLYIPWPHWSIAIWSVPRHHGRRLFGAFWAFIPAYLQAKRGSHIVITTIMFNFIASPLLIYLLVNLSSRQTRRFRHGSLPQALSAKPPRPAHPELVLLAHRWAFAFQG